MHQWISFWHPVSFFLNLMIGYFSLCRSKSPCFVGPAKKMLRPTSLLASSCIFGIFASFGSMFVKHKPAISAENSWHWHRRSIIKSIHSLKHTYIYGRILQNVNSNATFANLVQTSNFPRDSGLGFVDMANASVYTVPVYTLLSADMRDKQFTILKSKQLY